MSIIYPPRASSKNASPVLALTYKRSLNLASRYGLLLLFIAFWQTGSHVGWLNPAVLPPPDRVISALYQGIVSGSLLGDITISLQRAGLAFFSAVIIGIPLGLFMGQSRVIEQALDPILQLFRSAVSGVYSDFRFGRNLKGVCDFLGGFIPGITLHHQQRERGRQ